jgi:hypothetical protein
MTSLGMWLVCLLFQIFNCRFDSSFRYSWVLTKTSWYVLHKNVRCNEMLIAHTTHRMVRNYALYSSYCIKELCHQQPMCLFQRYNTTEWVKLETLEKIRSVLYFSMLLLDAGFYNTFSSLSKYRKHIFEYNALELACAFYGSLSKGNQKFRWRFLI